MANIKVSELTEATAFNDNDYTMIVQSNSNKKVSKTNMLKSIMDAEEYSTSEVKTNKVWINNKPIYRKVIDFGYLPNASTTDKSSGLSDVVITHMYGVAASSNGNTLTIPEANAGNSIRLVFTNDNKVQVGTTYDRSSFYAYVVLEYYKTTD